MSEITPEILAKIAPGTPHNLRDRFIPFLNDACPRYGITSKLRVAAFLTTTAFESAYFRATKEGKAKADSKAGRAQAKYWSTGFYGRGIIQTTHREGYQAVGEYLKRKGVVDDSDLFVDHPELLEEPKWAVESACVFWTQNGLNRYADSGKIFAIEGITNRGSAAKPAWGEAEREALYKKVLSILPNDFSLVSAVDLAAKPTDSTSVQPTVSPDDTPTVAPPPISQQAETIPEAGPGDTVVEKEADPPGFFAKIKMKLAGWLTTIGGLTGIQQYKQSFDDLGIPIPPTIIEYVILCVLICFIGWLFFEAVKHWIVDPIRKRMLTTSLIAANTTPTNAVQIACPENLWQYAALGYKVVTRQ